MRFEDWSNGVIEIDAYRKTGGGEDCPEHFNVIVDPEWPVSTMILWPDKIFGRTDATGSFCQN